MRCVFVCLLLAALHGYGADLDPQVMIKHLQEHSEVFEPINIAPNEKPVDFQIKLGDKSTVIDGEYEFDGFRFKMPRDYVGSDMVWYFNAPQNWGNWYIIPVTGEVEGGFKKWFYADKVYKLLDKSAEQDRLRAHQSLSADYFKADTEYVIWFRKVSSGADSELRARLAFVKTDDEWNLGSIEEALFLDPQEAASQVAVLKSRGGKILLDKEFFSERYAENRIDSVFFSLRHTARMRGGFFTTIEVAMPPSSTHPSFKDIVKRYGPADFVVTPDEKELLNSHMSRDEDEDESEGEEEPGDKSEDEPDEEDEEDEVPVAVYYYDYFGFEVSPDDPEQKVCRVITHAKNYSVLKPVDDKPCFGSVDMQNLMVFYMNKKEVGRMYYFLEESKLPLVVKDPPVGIYKAEYQDLEYRGAGKWVRKRYFRDGKLARMENFEKHLMNGVAEGYYNNGKKSYVASYKDGDLHGEIIRYSEDEKEIERVVFENGVRQK